MTYPLEDIRVVELTTHQAGPACGRVLADMGAEVIKVERPGGESTRTTPAGDRGTSPYFAAHNSNKLSVTLDVGKPEGREILVRLIRKADVFLQNSRPGRMERWGLGYRRLRELKPQLIMVSVSGFGKGGPYSDRPAFDNIIQATAGLMSLTGTAEGPPTVTGASIADYLAAMNAAIGTMMALRVREKTGRGQEVDVSMFDGLLSVVMPGLTRYLLYGREPDRTGNRVSGHADIGVYRCADGYVSFNAILDHQWLALTNLLGAPELGTDPRFATSPARRAAADEVEAALVPRLAGRRVAELVSACEARGVPCGPVQTIKDLATDPHIQARGNLLDAETPDGGTVPVPMLNFRLEDTGFRRRTPMVAAPGAHNAQIYGGLLGFSAADLDRLDAEGVI
jgi:crotonobetainyl-CoA:carnitine CoA-transferase CaiB-like acyl-CoA transferase